MFLFSTRFKTCTLLSRHLSTSTYAKNRPIDYCVNLVKSRDYENYLCLSLLPQDVQAVGFTVRAFNIEVAQIQETTSNTQTGKMRVDFWRKNISKTYEGLPPNHPVAISLALCLEKQMLAEKWFHKIIDIRERYINNAAFMSLNDAEEYGEYASSSIFYLILESLGVPEHLDSSYAASHLGVACSLVTLIRSTPYFAKNGQVILPTELLVKHKLSQEEVIRNSNQSALKEAIYETASQAHLHLDGMKKLLDSVPDAKNVYLPYFSCDMFLKHIQKLDFDAFHPSWNKKQWTLPALLWYKSQRTKW